jgi:hypothetical protein
MRLLSVSLLAASLCIGCASRHHLPPEGQLRAEIEAMREAVSSEIPDAQRAARLDKAIDGYEAELLAFVKQTNTFRSKLVALNSRPDATRAEFATPARPALRDDRRHLSARVAAPGGARASRTHRPAGGVTSC